jgi:hypothetical protein
VEENKMIIKVKDKEPKLDFKPGDFLRYANGDARLVVRTARGYSTVDISDGTEVVHQSSLKNLISFYGDGSDIKVMKATEIWLEEK